MEAPTGRRVGPLTGAVAVAPPTTDMRAVTADSVVGSIGTLASRLTGLVRIVVVAAVLGPTTFGDLYQATNNLPNLVYELLTGALFVSLVVPALVRHVDRRDAAATARLASGFLTLSVGAALLVVGVLTAAGPLVLELLTSGAPDTADRTDSHAAWFLLGLLLLQVPLYLVAFMGAAVQNAHGRFGLAAAAPTVENLGIHVVMATYAGVFGAGAAGAHDLAAIALLGGGTSAAVLLHAVAQWWGARACGVRLRPLVVRGDAEIRELLRLAVPSLGYAGLSVLRYLSILVSAAAVPGGVVAFTLAITFYNLPVALGTRPVAAAALPGLSRAHAAGDHRRYGEAFVQSFGLALFLAVPAAVGLALLSGPLATAVAFGEMASADGRELLRLTLLGLSAGLVGEAALVFGTQAAYARRDGRRPLLAIGLRAVLTVAGLVVGSAVVDGPELMLVIASVVAASDLVAAAVLCWWLRRDLPPITTSMARVVGRLVLGSLAMAPVVFLGLAVGPTPTGHLTSTLLVLVAGLAGLATYLGAERLMNSPELAGLAALFRRRNRDAAPAADQARLP